jgi:hypothetical protein
MKLVNTILELVGLKKNEEFRNQFAILTARPQYMSFENIRGNNARTVNFNHVHATSWTKKAVWV